MYSYIFIIVGNLILLGFNLASYLTFKQKYWLIYLFLNSLLIGYFSVRLYQVM